MAWQWLWLLLSSSAFADVPLTIQVEDGVEQVTLDCNGRKKTETVRNGEVSFMDFPQNCKVQLTLRSGTITGTGTWKCTAQGCFQDIPPHRPVQAEPNAVHFILLGNEPPRLLELTCAGGYRQRSSVTEFVASFNNIPVNGDCTAYVKGGSTAKFHPVHPGVYACSISGPTLVCQPYSGAGN